MKPQSSLRYGLVAIITAFALGVATINQRAQTQSQFPSPTSYINDFANVLDTTTRERLERVLENFKTKTRIDFYIATVQDTGSRDIFDFSRQLANQWNLGARGSNTKSLLLVMSVDNKTSFTQFSRLVQSDLPEGILGEIALRMKSSLGTGQFSDALNGGIHHFVTAMARKLGFSPEDLEQPIAIAATESDSPSPVPTPNETPALSDTPQTRPRLVNEPATIDPSALIVETSAPPAEKRSRPRSERARQQMARKGTDTKPVAASTPATTEAPPAQVSEEDEEEEVELTLTLPLDKRAVKLEEFLATHPNSKARPRAIELLISTYAALGDQRLKNGDRSGVDLLLKALTQADATVNEPLFAGVIAQIPMNLYLRQEQAAAFQAAHEIERRFGDNPKRLLSVAKFYLSIERGDEAVRIADQVVKLQSELAEGHSARALGLHLSLRLDEATEAYRRVVELDPNSRSARTSLADLFRSSGKFEEALALYTEQLKADSKDKAATNGTVLSLLELNRTDEANNLLESALADDPRNFTLLTGAAYWFAAHENPKRAYELARRAIDIEPRYTWAQIALAHSFLELKRPLDAERSIRFARQYGKFPTLTYELANVLISMGLYEEAIEVLRESFVVDDGVIKTQLAGRFPATGETFIELIAPERRASIYQNKTGASPLNAKVMKDLLIFSNTLVVSGDNQKIDETAAVTAAREFAAGTDNMSAFRKVYAASRLLRNGIAFETVFELAQEARNAAEGAVDVPALTIAVQADEFRELRASAIAAGNVPDVADAPADVLADILRGRSDDLMGWALFNQARYEAALDYLKKATTTLPTGTPAWRTAVWHLAVAQEQAGDDAAALENYIASYKAGAPDPVRRASIEQIYKRVNGTLDGLEEKIGPTLVAESGASPQPPPTVSPVPETSSTSPDPGATPTPEKTPTPEASPAETPGNESLPIKTGENAPTSTPTPSAEPKPTPGNDSTPAETPATSPSESPTPVSAGGLSDEALRAAASRLRSTIKVTGRVVDSEKVGIPNVVVVLISPSGSVLAATTDSLGNYSFTVTPSQKRYRLIPSKDGFTFTPIDRAFVGLFEDQKEIDFEGRPTQP